MKTIHEIIEREENKIIIDQVSFVARNLIICEAEFKYGFMLRHQEILLYIPGIIEHIKYINESKSEAEYLRRIDDFMMLVKLYCPELFTLYIIEELILIYSKHGTLAYGNYTEYRQLLSDRVETQRALVAVGKELKSESEVED